MTVNNKALKEAYRVEELACKLNLNIQVLHYITQELEEFKLPADREPTLDDEYARVMQTSLFILEGLKEVREDLYKIFEDIR